MSQRFILNKNRHLFRKQFKKNVGKIALNKEEKIVENDKKISKVIRKKEKKENDIPAVIVDETKVITDEKNNE